VQEGKERGFGDIRKRGGVDRKGKKGNVPGKPTRDPIPRDHFTPALKNKKKSGEKRADCARWLRTRERLAKKKRAAKER